MMRKYLRSLSPTFWKINLILYLQSTSPPKAPSPPSKTTKQQPIQLSLSNRLFLVDMKISTILTASTLLGAFASAAPTSALDTRAFQVGVTFYGTDEGTSFFQTFLANEDPVNISKFLKKFTSHHKFSQSGIQD